MQIIVERGLLVHIKPLLIISVWTIPPGQSQQPAGITFKRDWIFSAIPGAYLIIRQFNYHLYQPMM